MSLRARLSSVEIDQIVLKHTSTATSSVKEALRAVREAEKNEQGRTRRRIRKTHQELRRILHQLETLSCVETFPDSEPATDTPDEDQPFSWVEKRALASALARQQKKERAQAHRGSE